MTIYFKTAGLKIVQSKLPAFLMLGYKYVWDISRYHSKSKVDTYDKWGDNIYIRSFLDWELNIDTDLGTTFDYVIQKRH